MSFLSPPLLLLPLLSACGDGEFPIRRAKGKVVCDGQPVTVGSVTFSPVAESGGKPATATVGPDGTFVLTSINTFDGAVVGKHRVQYVGPEGEEEDSSEDEGEAPPEGSRQERAEYFKRLKERQTRQKSQCVQTGELIVEVTADGENDFTIELSRPR